MGQTGSTEKVYRLLVRVGVAVEQRRQSGSARLEGALEKDLAAEVVAVREGGDVATILETERIMLRDEYERFANTTLTKASLSAALEEVDAALANGGDGAGSGHLSGAGRRDAQGSQAQDRGSAEGRCPRVLRGTHHAAGGLGEGSGDG